MTADPRPPTLNQGTYWRRTRRFTLLLLMVWFIVTFIVIFFARELAGFTFFGWPVSFYMAAQGTTLVYVGIVGCYAWRMRHFDRAAKGGDNDAA